MEPPTRQSRIICSLLCILTLHRFHLHTSWSMYSTSNTLQLTIITMHLTLIAVQKSNLRNAWLPTSLILIYVMMSHYYRSTRNPGPYTLVIPLLESSLLSLPTRKSNLLLPTLSSLNILIIIGFWVAMILASLTPGRQFMPLDEWLHFGLAYTLSSPVGRGLFMREVVGHGVCQALAVFGIWSRTGPQGLGTRDVISALSCWAVLVVSVAFLVGEGAGQLPYGLALPYHLGMD